MNAILKETIRSFLPTRIRPHRIRRGPIAGRSICTSWHDYPGAIRGNTEAALLNWLMFHVKHSETWLDVGAHYGYTAIAMAELVGEDGRVFAFEPVLATADCIERTRKINHLPQIQVVPFGLTAEGGIQFRNLPTSRGMADSTLSGGAPSLRILLTSFDHLWPTLDVHGVKIDVQGMEAEVLAGMEGMLRRCQPRLVIEFHRGVNYAGILDFLASCGYDRNPNPIEPGSQSIQADCSYAFAASSISD